ncbi:MAG TPA: penicillin-binding protein, partial [Clostridia bacterium]|nr:penicillin-binding protein [Clostridia bacterium]
VLDPVFPDKEGENAIRAAVVVMEVNSGHVLAIAGRAHQGKLSFVDAVDAKRQPGSAFKPIVVYSAAMETGFSPGTVVDDAPVAFKVGSKIWRPKNYNGRYKGLVTIRYALEQSLNVPAVKVFDAIGPETGVQYAKKLGITDLVTDKRKPKHDLFLPTALGGITVGVTPLEMANAYGTLANRGIHVTPVVILKVTDQSGNILEENTPSRTRALSEEAAYLVTDMLRGVITRGTGTRANIGRPAAGKTGTSDDYADAWFIGYTPKLVASVWMGYAERKPMDGIVGGKYPAMIWQKTMSAALKGVPAEDFKRPSNIITCKICTKSGKLPGPFCPAECISEDIFIAGQQPTQTCDVHVPVEVCAENPTMLASPYCPSVVVKSFIKRPTPYTPGPDGKVPEDAVMEIPTKMCDKHTPLQLPEVEPAPVVPGEPPAVPGEPSVVPGERPEESPEEPQETGEAHQPADQPTADQSTGMPGDATVATEQKQVVQPDNTQETRDESQDFR